MRLQTVSRGLLGFFQALNTGKTPTELADAVVPTYDVVDHYRPYEIATAAGDLLETAHTITVPTGEMWRVADIALSCTALASGQRVDYTGRYAHTVLGEPITLIRIHSTAQAVANGQITQTQHYPKGFMAQAGDVFVGFGFPGIATGVGRITLRFQRFPQT